MCAALLSAHAREQGALFASASLGVYKICSLGTGFTKCCAARRLRAGVHLYLLNVLQK